MIRCNICWVCHEEDCPWDSMSSRNDDPWDNQEVIVGEDGALYPVNEFTDEKLLTTGKGVRPPRHWMY